MKQIRVVVEGSLIFDLMTKAKTLPRVGQTLLGTGFAMGSGGKGANQAVQLARLGADVTMIGRVGADFMGDYLLEKLKGEKIDTSFIIRDKESSTGICAIHVDEEGRNDIIVVLLANSRCSAPDVEAAEKRIAEADIVLSQLETTNEAMEKTVELGVKYGKRVILNPAPASPVRSEIFNKVFLVTPNEKEAEEISGVMQGDYPPEEWRKRAASSFHEQGAKNVILTLGEAGAYYSSEGKELFVKAFKIKPEDSTAAGDAFNGALCYALALGKSVEEAIVWGNAAGALAVSRIGSQSSLCTMEELAAFLKKTAN